MVAVSTDTEKVHRCELAAASTSHKIVQMTGKYVRDDNENRNVTIISICGDKTITWCIITAVQRKVCCMTLKNISLKSLCVNLHPLLWWTVIAIYFAEILSCHQAVSASPIISFSCSPSLLLACALKMTRLHSVRMGKCGRDCRRSLDGVVTPWEFWMWGK